MARVPQMEKDLVALRAKVKEDDQGRHPNSAAAAQTALNRSKPDKEKSDDELEAELKQAAEQIDAQGGFR
jgi:hypothetical protein